MEELLKEIMDRGFLIYRYETDPPLSSAMDRPKFVLKKIQTPADHTNMCVLGRPFGIRQQKADDVLIEYFASFEEALDKASKMIDWKDPELKKIAPKHSWTAQLMYRHIGLGPQFEELGEVDNMSYVEAMEAAKILAEAYVTEYLEEDEIDGWDARVRPCNR